MTDPADWRTRALAAERKLAETEQWLTLAQSEVRKLRAVVDASVARHPASQPTSPPDLRVVTDEDEG